MPEAQASLELEAPKPVTAPAGATPASTVETPAATPTGATPDPAGETPAKPIDEVARAKRRADTAYRKHAEQKARADILEKQLQDLKPKEAVSDPEAPKFENYTDIEKYAKDLAKHESDKAIKEHESKRQTQARQEQQQALVSGWEAKVARTDGKYDDFEEIVGELQPTTPWATAIMDADNGEDIAYYLGKNIEEAKKIASLSALGQIRAIGRIEAKLLAEPPKPKTPSKAPAPITPVSGAAPTVTDVPSEQDDLKTWMKKRNKQVHKR